MVLSTDAKFVNLLSPRLQRFKRKENYLFNFRCPFCETGPGRKARGYVYERNGRLNFFCHKCSESMSVGRLIKRLDTGLYGEYLRESMLDRRGPHPPALPVLSFPPPRKFTPIGVGPLSKLDASHPAKVYIASRKIPESVHLMYSDDFYGWANKIVPGKYADMRREGRLVIPFIGFDGELVGFQGRSLDKTAKIKYVTVVLREDAPFLYNADRVHDGDVFAFEGPIDAMFVDNAVATGGGDVAREILRSPLDPGRVIVVYDCERRSPHTVKKMLAAAEKGLRVCVWPDSIKHKDVNDMVLAGMDPRDITEIIRSSARSGPQAMAAIAAWRRC